MLFCQSSALVALCLSTLSLAEVFDLSSLKWTLKNANGSIHIPATIPSQAHLDLHKAGIISEPLLGINDYTQRWIVSDNWTYTADLSPLKEHLVEKSIEQTLLVFYGIDTIANITYAGHQVAWVNNQFRQYVYDVSGLLASKGSHNSNTNLTVSLESAWLYGLNVTSRPDAEHFPESISDDYEYPGVRHYIRKVASDFGWDWGPAFVPSGIFKPAYLVTLDKQSKGHSATSPTSAHSTSVFIEESSIDIYKVGQNFSTAPVQTADWVVNVSLAIRSPSSFSKPFLKLSIPELKLESQNLPVASIKTTADNATWVQATWHIPDSIPERWYTHDLGTPKLYNLTIALSSGSSDLASFTTTTGFRTIELVQSPYSSKDVAERGITPGDQWHFAINGKTFYSKGTNIIPFDPFYARTTTDDVRWILESAVKSGQNMLRVWGGGTYQPSDSATAGGVYDFYSACDELGILAWSELIFSDTVYPVNGFLLESIEPEVRQNVRRINRHPSNAQWAGGNEIEGIVTGSESTLSNGQQILDEFLYLFQDFLFNIVTSETRSVPYTDCSTTKGVLSLDPYELRLNNATAGEIYGNSERYNYDATQAFNLSTYPVARFINEFGFHSMPSFYSWEDVLSSPDDFKFNGTVVESRDHHPPAGNLSWPNPNAPQGQAQLTEAVTMWLPTPGTSDSNQTFAQWCWSTQVFQSMNMVAQIAWYRRGAGKGENNLGSLVWQLNDIWQGVSWSSIEYSGRWKVLQYGLTNVYTPVIISPFWTAENQTLEILVTSDVLDSIQGTAQLTWYDWNGTALNVSKHEVTVPSLNNSEILYASGLSSIIPSGHNASDVWLLLNVSAKVDGKSVTNEQYFTPVSLAEANLSDPQIKVSSKVSGDVISFTLSSSKVAPWTWIDHPLHTIGYFEDSESGAPLNGFYLVPGIERTVKFVLSEALSTIKPNPADFVVRSLWNNTHV